MISQILVDPDNSNFVIWNLNGKGKWPASSWVCLTPLLCGMTAWRLMASLLSTHYGHSPSDLPGSRWSLKVSWQRSYAIKSYRIVMKHSWPLSLRKFICYPEKSGPYVEEAAICTVNREIACEHAARWTEQLDRFTDKRSNTFHSPFRIEHAKARYLDWNVFASS